MQKSHFHVTGLWWGYIRSASSLLWCWAGRSTDKHKVHFLVPLSSRPSLGMVIMHVFASLEWMVGTCALWQGVIQVLLEREKAFQRVSSSVIVSWARLLAKLHGLKQVTNSIHIALLAQFTKLHQREWQWSHTVWSWAFSKVLYISCRLSHWYEKEGSCWTDYCMQQQYLLKWKLDYPTLTLRLHYITLWRYNGIIAHYLNKTGTLYNSSRSTELYLQ